MCCLPCWVLNSFPVTISCLQRFKPAGIQGHAPSVILQNFLHFSVHHVLSLPPDVPSQPTSTISSLKSPVLPLKPPIALQVLHRVWITPQDGLGLTLHTSLCASWGREVLSPSPVSPIVPSTIVHLYCFQFMPSRSLHACAYSL